MGTKRTPSKKTTPAKAKDGGVKTRSQGSPGNAGASGSAAATEHPEPATSPAPEKPATEPEPPAQKPVETDPEPPALKPAPPTRPPASTDSRDEMEAFAARFDAERTAVETAIMAGRRALEETPHERRLAHAVIERRLSRAMTSLEKRLASAAPEDYAKILEASDELEDAARGLMMQLAETEKPERTESMASSRPVGTPASQLPRISLPTFVGDTSKFRRFRDQFKSLVLDREDISDTIKITHLLSALGGEAEEAYGNIEPLGENLEFLITSLNDQYGDPSALLILEVERLNALSAVMAEDDVGGLRHLINAFEAGLREIRSLHRTLLGGSSTGSQPAILDAATATTDLFVGPLLVGKLPEKVATDWQRERVGRQRFQLDQLIIWLKKEVAMKEAHARRKTGVSAPHPAATVMAYAVASAPFRPKPPKRRTKVGGASTRKCKLCDLPWHRLTECQRFLGMSTSDRRRFLLDARHCTNCFNTNHKAEDGKCSPRCCGQHHPLVCGGMVTSRTTSSHSPSGPLLSTPILETAIARVYSSAGKSAVVRVLFDPGSDTSYVTESLVRQLDLPTLRSAPFKTIVFGGQSRVEERRLTSAMLSSNTADYKVPGLFWTSETITAPLPPAKLPPYARQFVYAEDYWNGGRERPVDLLVGMDQYWNLVKGPISRIGPQLVLLDTFFGRVLSGVIPGDERGDGHRTGTTLRVQSAEIERTWALEAVGIKAEELHDPLPDPTRRDGRIEVSLPWKNDARPTDNLPAVRARQGKMEEALTPEHARQYGENLEELVKAGIVDALSCSPSPGYYLPHRGIWRNNKLRVVFDGGAPCRVSKTGVNGLLHTGPNLLVHLVKVLVSFRLRAVALQSDIRAAFHQLSVAEADRPYIRFIWRNAVFQFLRLPFGLNPAPWLLCAAIEYLLDEASQKYPHAVSALRGSIYMDDLCCAVDTPEEAASLRQAAAAIFGSAGMSLKPWTPPEDDRCSTSTVLGLDWAHGPDVITVRLMPQPIQQPLTRRRLLSAVAATFDPLGLATPWILGGRHLCQLAWQIGGGWDGILPPWIRAEVDKWAEEAIRTPSMTVPRHVGLCHESEIHLFVDASEVAYSAAIYLRNRLRGSAHLLAAKARLAPLKQQLTIPRMELMGALIGARLLKLVIAADAGLDRLPVFCWTDSECVRAWLGGEPGSLKRFESNRVAEIQEATGKHWRRVPTALNPADLATRPSSVDTLRSNLWLHGPSYLNQTGPLPNLSAPVPEHRTLRVAAPAFDPAPEEIPLASTYRVSVRRVALLLRVTRRWRKLEVPALTVQEKRLYIPRALLSEAEDLLLRREQQREMQDDYRRLQSGAPVLQSSKLAHSRPVFEEKRQLISTIPRFSTAARLVFLPSSGPLFRLIVLDSHDKLRHSGPLATLAEVKRNYDTIRAGGRAKRILRTACGPCLRTAGASFRTKEAPLPDWRSAPAPAFDQVGVDHIGPLKRGTSKLYLLLAVCAVTRAVHLEVQESLSADDTSRALRRFFARRGVPSKVVSDNHPTFVALSQMVANWDFLPAKSPWMGGFYERLVAMVKRSICTTLGLSHVHPDEFRTVVAEVEEVINRRPLMETDGEPLTPAHFITGLPPPRHESRPESNPTLLRAWAHRAKLANDTWRRFHREYLPSLRAWRTARGGELTPREGELVLVDDAPRPRLTWPLARVRTVHPHHCEITLRGRETTRPTVRLHRLEAAQERPTSPLQALLPAQVRPSPLPELPATAPPESRTRSGRTTRQPDRYVGT
jgi:hypothetical protein